MTKQLTDPPTEAEVEEMVAYCQCFGELRTLARRLAHDRDRLQTAANQLADALEMVCSWEAPYYPGGEEHEKLYQARIVALEIIAERKKTNETV